MLTKRAGTTGQCDRDDLRVPGGVRAERVAQYDLDIDYGQSGAVLWKPEVAAGDCVSVADRVWEHHHVLHRHPVPDIAESAGKSRGEHVAKAG